MYRIKDEQGWRLCAKIGRTILDRQISLPSSSEVLTCLDILEKVFTGKGRVNLSYARNAAIGLNLALALKHKSRGSLLLEDINANKRIYLDEYI